MASSTASFWLLSLYMVQWPYYMYLLACKDSFRWAWSALSWLYHGFIFACLAPQGVWGRTRGLCFTAGLSCSEGQPSWGSSPSPQLSLTNRPAQEHGLDGKLQISQTPLHQGHNRWNVEGHPLMRMMITSSVGEKTPPNCTCSELQQEYIYTDRQIYSAGVDLQLTLWSKWNVLRLSPGTLKLLLLGLHLFRSIKSHCKSI